MSNLARAAAGLAVAVSVVVASGCAGKVDPGQSLQASSSVNPSAKPSANSSGKAPGSSAPATRKPLATKAKRAVLATAEVPAFCGHPAGRLVDHRGKGQARLVTDDPDRTPIAADMDGNGTEDLVAVYTCDVHERSRNDALLVLDGTTGKLIAWLDPATWTKSSYKTFVTDISATPEQAKTGVVAMKFKAADVELSKGLTWHLRASMGAGKIVLAPASSAKTSVEGPVQVLPFYLNDPAKTSKLPRIANLREFAAGQMTKATAKDGCEAYLGFDKLDPAGTVTAFLDSCTGAKTHQVWGFAKGSWVLAASWDDKAKGPACADLAKSGATISSELVPTCTKNGSTVAWTQK